MNRITVPGKILLMGEYSVIEGGKALFAALNPGISYSLDQGTTIEVHPESPLGIYQKEFGKIDLKRVNWTPTSAGTSISALGLGSSTADLIAGAALAQGKIPETAELWSWYRNQFPRASGADLAIQNEALKTASGFFEVEAVKWVLPLKPSSLFRQIFVFHASAEQKLPTHVDLSYERSNKMDLEKANELVSRFRVAVEDTRQRELIVLTEWAQWLSTLGLETEFSTRVREAFSQVPGVLGVKGCGAGLNDVFLVALDESAFGSAKVSDGFSGILKKYDLSSLGSLQERLWT